MDKIVEHLTRNVRPTEPDTIERTKADIAERTGLYAELYAAVSAVQIAGPANVADAAAAYKNAVSGPDPVAQTQAEERFVSLARETLGSHTK